jgi:hypothetical protein
MTLSALGIFSAAGAGVVAASSYELISTTILGTAASSVTFSSLGDYSSTYKHLQIRTTTRSAGAGSEFLRLEVNGSGLTIRHYLYGQGSSVLSGAADLDFGAIPNTGSTSGNFSAGIFDLLDAYNTSKTRTIRAFIGAQQVWGVGLLSGLLNSTSATSSFTVKTYNGANFATGSRFSIYGIKG